MHYDTESVIRRRPPVLAVAAMLAAGVGAGLAQRGPDAPLPHPAAVAPAPLAKAAATVAKAAIPVAKDDKAKLAADKLSDAERLVAEEIDRGGFPGAALAAGRGAHLAVMRGIGSTEWGAGKVDPERAVYDIASLSKVVATTSAVMLLVQDGRMDLDAPVSRYLPEFTGGAKGTVTLRHLLTHTSGLPAGTGVAGTPEQTRAKMIATPLVAAPGAKMVYSDVGFVVLFAAAEQAAGEPVARLLQERVFGPLGMASTGYLPGEGCARCVPTYRTAAGVPVRGKVHDPIARAMGGVAGNAGLFSTAADLARFAAMLANGGELEGVRVFDEATIRTFTEKQPNAGNRALGWETPTATGGSAGTEVSRKAFGHTGFTGTSLWVDPESGTWTVLLANRTFDPHASNRIQALRRAVNDRVAEAADLADLDGVVSLAE